MAHRSGERPGPPDVLLFRALIPGITDALNLQEVLTEIVSEATELLRAEAGDIILKDAEAGVLRVVAVAGFPSELVGVEYGLEEGLAARVMSTRRTLSVRDYRRYRYRVPQLDPYNIRAVLSSPLVARGEAIGVLTVGTELDAGFVQEDARLLTAFAKHAAVAIDNARRFEHEALLVGELERANDELSRSLTVQRRLVDQVLSDAGPEAVLKELSTLLARAVVLQDHRLRIIAGASPRGGERWDELVINPSALENPALRRFLGDLAAAGRTRVVPDILGPPSRLCAPVTSGRFNVHGYLVLPEQPSTTTDRALIDAAATGMALEMLKQAARVETEQLVRGELVTDLVSGLYNDEELMAARASRLGYDLSRARDLLVIRIDERPGAMTRLGGEVVRTSLMVTDVVQSELKSVAPESIVGGIAGGVVILASPGSRQSGGYGSRSPRALAELLCGRLAEALPEHSFSAAVGELCSRPDAYARSFDLAQRSLDAMAKVGRHGVVIDVAELGLYRLVVAATPNEELNTFVRGTLQPLLDQGQRGQDLIETFQAYIDSGFNQRETARRAYLHINTVANRLQKIEQLLNVRLSEPDTLVELAVALRIAKLTDGVQFAARPPSAQTANGRARQRAAARPGSPP